jgi:hypothetical protein
MAINIQNVSYFNATVSDDYTVTLKDNQGNTFAKTVILSNSTTGAQTFLLPELTTIANDCEVIIVITGDTNNVSVTPASGDTIGSEDASYVIALGGGVGANYVFTPVDATRWSVLKTA